jgi:hypothetical protein
MAQKAFNGGFYPDMGKDFHSILAIKNYRLLYWRKLAAFGMGCFWHGISLSGWCNSNK